MVEYVCMERKFEFAPEEYYHLYNRGNDKRAIFLINADRERFTKLLYLANGTKGVSISGLPKNTPLKEIDRGESLVCIGAYCLMPNHFHILAKERDEGGISKFMLKLSTGYSMYFNKRHDRAGSLFEGPFKAKHVDNDSYLEYLYGYIHLNPIKLQEPKWKEIGIQDMAAAENYLKEYKYSSYLDYIEDFRDISVIIDKPAFPEYFASKKEFIDFHRYWLKNAQE